MQRLNRYAVETLVHLVTMLNCCAYCKRSSYRLHRLFCSLQASNWSNRRFRLLCGFADLHPGKVSCGYARLPREESRSGGCGYIRVSSARSRSSGFCGWQKRVKPWRRCVTSMRYTISKRRVSHNAGHLTGLRSSALLRPGLAAGFQYAEGAP